MLLSPETALPFDIDALHLVILAARDGNDIDALKRQILVRCRIGKGGGLRGVINKGSLGKIFFKLAVPEFGDYELHGERLEFRRFDKTGIRASVASNQFAEGHRSGIDLPDLGFDYLRDREKDGSGGIGPG